MSHVAVTERGCNGGEWRARERDYETLMHAFESGAAFLTFQTIDGADITVRSSEIVAIAFVTDASLAAARARSQVEDMGSA